MNLLKSSVKHSEARFSTLAVWSRGATASDTSGQLINRWAAADATTRFVKFKAHRARLRAEPLNEAADTMASAAAELDPFRPLDLNPEAVYFYC